MLLAAGSAGIVRADDPAKVRDAQGVVDPQAKLRGLTETIDASDARRKALANDIATYTTDRARFQSSLLAMTRKTAEDEARIVDTEARLETLDARQATIKRALESRRALIAELLASLQRMSRKPPPALLVEPEDVLKAIRTSMLLGAVLPGMRIAAEKLIADLDDLTRTRKAIADERKALEEDLALVGRERVKLSALVDARQAALGKAEADQASERDKAKQLAEQVGSLKELIGRMERDSAPVLRGTQAAQQSDQKLAALVPGAVPPGASAPFKDPARLAPAVAFATTKGLLPLPVSGSVLRRFGEDDGLGGSEKGTLFATPAGAIVASPADGWVAYAGPYRSFGQLLILNVGGGYYIVLAGMDRVNVSLGQFVLAGEPVAVMGDGSVKTAAAVALGATQPVLYVEFRKDGATIDPGPWWARPELQKVRG